MKSQHEEARRDGFIASAAYLSPGVSVHGGNDTLAGWVLKRKLAMQAMAERLCRWSNPFGQIKQVRGSRQLRFAA